MGNTAKVFMTGRSQGVRLPKEFRFKSNEVRIRKEGNAVILEPLPEDWSWLNSVCQKTPLSELSCHDPPHFPRQLQPNFVQEDASDRSGWGDWWWTGPDLRDAAIGRRSRLLGSGFKG